MSDLDDLCDFGDFDFGGVGDLCDFDDFGEP